MCVPHQLKSAAAERPGGDPGAQASSVTGRFTNIVQLGAVGSTNEIAAERAAAGVAEGLVVVAAEQRSGRGRRGRRWVAPPGSSLLCSVVLRPPFGPAEGHLAVACLALAAREVARERGIAAALKWPNDLVVAPRGGGRPGKLAGVLAEWVAPDALVVGIGCNLDWGDEPLPDGVTSFAAAGGVSASPAAVLDEVLAALERRYAPLVSGGAPRRRAAARLAAERRATCVTIGELVRVEPAGRTAVCGRAVDVADDGRLVVARNDGGFERFSEGDVVHLRPTREAAR